MIKDAIAKLAERADLSEKEAEEALLDIMCGSASPVQIAAYLMGLRVKGETVEEIAGSARAMRAQASRIRVTDPLVLDTCGTGGDRSGTFNISTAAAFVAAGSGVTVAKHGNRSVSSRCGSADVLSALGVNIDLPAARVEECVNDVGIGFLFAPLFHGAMKHCAPVRQELGVRTLLNILGPLSNPAGATMQVVGVYDYHLYGTHGEGVGASRHATLFCRARDGRFGRSDLDGANVGLRGKAGVVSSYFLDPKDFGLERVRLKDLSGGSIDDNALIVREVLRGRTGPKRDVVCLNAALALVACRRAKTVQQGFELSVQVIESGAAMEKLERLVEFTKK